MDTDTKRQQDRSSSDSSDKQKQSAIPYIPPQPPSTSPQKFFRSPLMNGMVAALAILLGGFMMYHFIGYQLTTLAGISQERTVAPSPSPMPSIVTSIAPSASLSVSPSQETSPSPTP